MKYSLLELGFDVKRQLRETSQIYLIGHDTVISVSKSLFKMLDAKRKAKAEAKGIPQEQYEWEDFLMETCLSIEIPTIK